MITIYPWQFEEGDHILLGTTEIELLGPGSSDQTWNAWDCDLDIPAEVSFDIDKRYEIVVK